jgi:hypothetical protein
MASHATAYDSTGELKSAKFGPPLPSPLVRRIDASRLPGRLARTLRCMVIASQQGPDLWASTFAVSIEAAVSYRTVQRHIDELERRRVLKKKHDANSFVGKSIRRTATYTLHGEAEKQLEPRQSYVEWKACNRRQAPSRFRPRQVAHSSQPSPTSQEAPAPRPVAPPADAHRSTERPLRRLTPREGPKLVSEMRRLMRGITKVSGEGFPLPSSAKHAWDMEPSDPRYRAPMSQENALVAACMNLGIPYESAVEHLKLCRFTDGSETPEGP